VGELKEVVCGGGVSEAPVVASDGERGGKEKMDPPIKSEDDGNWASEDDDVPPKAGDQKTFDGIEFVYCPAGSFMMGSPEDEEDRFHNELQHDVEISQGFWLGKVPVTQGQWEEVVGEWPENEPDDFVGKGVNYPAYDISWEDAQEFISKLNSNARSTIYRLPSEAEWEYACRAGSKSAYCFGDSEDQLGKYAWFDGNSGGKTHPVGKKAANAWGLHDIGFRISVRNDDGGGRYPTPKTLSSSPQISVVLWLDQGIHHQI